MSRSSDLDDSPTVVMPLSGSTLPPAAPPSSRRPIVLQTQILRPLTRSMLGSGDPARPSSAPPPSAPLSSAPSPSASAHEDVTVIAPDSYRPHQLGRDPEEPKPRKRPTTEIDATRIHAEPPASRTVFPEETCDLTVGHDARSARLSPPAEAPPAARAPAEPAPPPSVPSSPPAEKLRLPSVRLPSSVRGRGVLWACATLVVLGAVWLSAGQASQAGKQASRQDGASQALLATTPSAPPEAAAAPAPAPVPTASVEAFPPASEPAAAPETPRERTPANAALRAPNASSERAAPRTAPALEAPAETPSMEPPTPRAAADALLDGRRAEAHARYRALARTDGDEAYIVVARILARSTAAERTKP